MSALPTPAAVRGILVLHGAAGLGNLVLLRPLLAGLRRAWPAARITVVTPPAPLARDVLGGLADELLVLDARRARRRTALRFAWRELRPRRCELGLATFFAPTVLSACVLAVAGCRWRVAYARSAARGLLNTVSVLEAGGHEVTRHRRLLGAIGCGGDDEPRFMPSAADTDHAARLLRARPDRALVGIHPGCDRANAAKRWPVERFAALAERVTRTAGADVAVVLGPDDADLAPAFAPLGERVRVVSGATIGVVAAVLARCDVVVSNDSGLMHLAAAVGTPTVAIFGPTDPVKNAPRGAATVLLADGVACRPCHVRSPIACHRPARDCLEAIGVERVLAALRAHLPAVGGVAAAGARA